MSAERHCVAESGPLSPSSIWPSPRCAAARPRNRPGAFRLPALPGHLAGPATHPRLRHQPSLAEIRLHQGTGTEPSTGLTTKRYRAEFSRPDRDDMAWLEMWRQPLALCVADHWVAGRSTVSLSDAAGEPFISTPKSFHSRDLLDAVAADEGIEAKVAYESDELSTVAGLVVAGIGVALLPADDPYLPLAGATFTPAHRTDPRDRAERRADHDPSPRPAGRAAHRAQLSPVNRRCVLGDGQQGLVVGIVLLGIAQRERGHRLSNDLPRADTLR